MSGGTAQLKIQINLGLSPGNFSISLTDANNCFTDTSFNIATMSADCIPNVFTPNSDNINDTWNLEDTYLYNDSKVKIYGRFGKLIFQSVGYNEKWMVKMMKALMSLMEFIFMLLRSEMVLMI